MSREGWSEPEEAVQILGVLDELFAHDLLFWSVEHGKVNFFVLTNDFFWWASGDSEDVTVADLPALKQAYKDVGPRASAQRWAGLLYAARKRGMRPQGCAYPKEDWLIKLFDACGPKRPVNVLNPYNHPEDGGGYAYEEPPPPLPGSFPPSSS